MINDESPAPLNAKVMDRLDAMEMRIAYQERWLDELDKAVAEQSRQLSRLEEMNQIIRMRLREQQSALTETDTQTAPRSENEVPPHY